MYHIFANHFTVSCASTEAEKLRNNFLLLRKECYVTKRRSLEWDTPHHYVHRIQRLSNGARDEVEIRQDCGACVADRFNNVEHSVGLARWGNRQQAVGLGQLPLRAASCSAAHCQLHLAAVLQPQCLQVLFVPCGHECPNDGRDDAADSCEKRNYAN